MFAAPAFLLGLLAIGIPLWLHRMARADPTHQPFASLMLIEASEIQRSARHTLRYWLLLATRVALIIALALAFAGLLLPANVAPGPASNARLHAIVLDTSLSMRHGERWQRALERAQSILGGLRRGDQAMLVTAAGRRIEIVHEPVMADRAGALQAALQRLEPSLDRLDYGLLMSTASGWLGSALLPVELHIITDLQQSASPVRFADLQPPLRTDVVLHDVGEEDAANTYIEGAAIDPHDNRALYVTVATTAHQAQKREVVLYVDGAERARRTIEAPAAETGIARTRVRFPALELGAGTHRIELALTPRDALPDDDRFNVVFEHTEPRVLLIARDTASDEAAYLAAAIESVTAPRLTVQRRAATDVEREDLSDYAAVVVADSTTLSSAAGERIREYVSSGGAALVTMGAGAVAQSDPLTALRARVVADRPARVGQIDSSHVVLREAESWHRIKFFRHLQLEPSATAEPSERVLIALDDGSPLLIERSTGAGRLLILAAPLDREWNDLAIHPLFVRFVADVARYLSAHDDGATSVTVGAPVMTGLTGPTAGQIFDPEGRRVLPLGETTAARFVPETAGFFEIRGAQGSRWIAANVDRRESDLRRMSAASVARWRALEPPPAAEEAAAEGETAGRRSLGELFLWIAAALLLIEILLANRHLKVRREAVNV